MLLHKYLHFKKKKKNDFCSHWIKIIPSHNHNDGKCHFQQMKKKKLKIVQLKIDYIQLGRQYVS